MIGKVYFNENQDFPFFFFIPHQSFRFIRESITRRAKLCQLVWTSPRQKTQPTNSWLWLKLKKLEHIRWLKGMIGNPKNINQICRYMFLWSGKIMPWAKNNIFRCIRETLIRRAKLCQSVWISPRQKTQPTNSRLWLKLKLEPVRWLKVSDRESRFH